MPPVPAERRQTEAFRPVAGDAGHLAADQVDRRGRREASVVEVLERALPRLIRRGFRIVTVSDDEVAGAIRAFYADTHNLAGSVAHVLTRSPPPE